MNKYRCSKHVRDRRKRTTSCLINRSGVFFIICILLFAGSSMAHPGNPLNHDKGEEKLRSVGADTRNNPHHVQKPLKSSPERSKTGYPSKKIAIIGEYTSSLWLLGLVWVISINTLPEQEVVSQAYQLHIISKPNYLKQIFHHPWPFSRKIP